MQVPTPRLPSSPLGSRVWVKEGPSDGPSSAESYPRARGRCGGILKEVIIWYLVARARCSCSSLRWLARRAAPSTTGDRWSRCKLSARSPARHRQSAFRPSLVRGHGHPDLPPRCIPRRRCITRLTFGSGRVSSPLDANRRLQIETNCLLSDGPRTRTARRRASLHSRPQLAPSINICGQNTPKIQAQNRLQRREGGSASVSR